MFAGMVGGVVMGKDGGGGGRGGGAGVEEPALCGSRSVGGGEKVPAAVADPPSIRDILTIFNRHILLARNERRTFMHHPFYYTHHPPSIRDMLSNLSHCHHHR